MGDNAWSWSTCNPAVQWYGVPGAGSYYWTQRYGQYWVGGGVYQRYASAGFECGGLGAPVKEYQWLSEFAAYGMWFQFGAIYYQGGSWKIAFGDWGQTAGRLTAEPEPVIPDDAERPPEGEVPVTPDDPPPVPEA